jgi:hypothetical protein
VPETKISHLARGSPELTRDLSIPGLEIAMPNGVSHGKYLNRRKVMSARIILLAGAALFVAQSPGAATPKISGMYNVSISEYCQPVIDPWPNGTNVLFNGLHSSTTAVDNFNATTGQVSASGETISGDAIVTNSTAGNMALNQYEMSGAYTNTAKMLTLDGREFNIDYKYVLKGLARSFNFYRRNTAGNGVTAENCVVEGNASIVP